jgi:hypothetical protein
MLEQLLNALGLADFDVLDLALWLHGPYESKPSERAALLFEGFLTEIGRTDGRERLTDWTSLN